MVTAVDASARYEGCAELFAESWLKISANSRFEYIPVIIRVDATHIYLPDTPAPIAHGCGKSSFVAQNIRSLACAFQDTDLAMTSDIDMLPGSARYFDEIASTSIRSSAYTVARNVLPEGQVPICYNIASPATWAKVFQTSPTDLIQDRLESLWVSALMRGPYSGIHGGDGWHFDQEDLFQKIEYFEQTGGKVERLSDSQTGHKRLDRSLRFSILIRARLRAVKMGRYSDFHIPLPVAKHAELLARFVSKL